MVLFYLNIGSVWSTFCNEVEIWKLKAATIKRLEALDLWFHWMMLIYHGLKGPFTNRYYREQIAKIGLLTIIKYKKNAYLGHVSSGEKYTVYKLIFKGRSKSSESRQKGNNKPQKYTILDWHKKLFYTVNRKS